MNSYRVEKHQMMPYKEYEYHIFKCYGVREAGQMTFMLRGENLPNLFEDDASRLVEFLNEVLNHEWFYLDNRLINRNGMKINDYINGFGLDFELYSIDFDKWEERYEY